MNKWVVVIIVAVILAGIGILISRSSNTVNTTNAYPPSQSTAQQTSSPTSTGQPSSTPVAQAQNTITLTSSGFEPATLTIKAGDKVTWVNKSGSGAAVNSAPHPIHTDYPPLNLGTFPDGGTLSLTFDKVGTYKYHNHLNPSQLGTIIVQ